VPVRYFPEVFDVPDVEGAKRIILTYEGPGADTEIRWARETPYVMELLQNAVSLRPDMIMLDYGCGIGRMAKAMIEASGCSVIGVDISPSMRALAADYVGSERFAAVSPTLLDRMVRSGLRVSAAISVWVLQHCQNPEDDIDRVSRSLAPAGNFFVLNMRVRAIPVIDESGQMKWGKDEFDVAQRLRDTFHVTAEGEPDRSRTPNMADAGAVWMSLQAKAV
jgi:cyclopropane fatty-acyl-phospholipid synthase-like methyltransferase